MSEAKIAPSLDTGEFEGKVKEHETANYLWNGEKRGSLSLRNSHDGWGSLAAVWRYFYTMEIGSLTTPKVCGLIFLLSKSIVDLNHQWGILGSNSDDRNRDIWIAIDWDWANVWTTVESLTDKWYQFEILIPITQVLFGWFGNSEENWSNQWGHRPELRRRTSPASLKKPPPMIRYFHRSCDFECHG
jgi:hypothetical protein